MSNGVTSNENQKILKGTDEIGNGNQKITNQDPKISNENQKITKEDEKIDKINKKTKNSKDARIRNEYEKLRKEIEKIAMDLERVSMDIETIRSDENKNNRVEIKYKSFEDFSTKRLIEFKLANTKNKSQAEVEEIASEKNRDHTKNELRNLENLTKSFGINLNIFKFQDDRNKYIITYEVANLFTYLLDFFMIEKVDPKRKLGPTDLTNEQLIFLRKLYFHALRSLKNQIEDIDNYIEIFNSITKAPLYYNDTYSELVLDAVKELKDSYHMEDENWGAFVDLLQFNYDHDWRLRFFEFAKKLLNDDIKDCSIK